MRMNADIKFDREVTDEYYICPGGYQMTAGGQDFAFDFTDSGWNICPEDPTVMEFEFRHPEFDEGRREEFDPKEITSIGEFFCYTGEHEDPEIHPVKLLSLVFDIDGEQTVISEDILRSADLTDGRVCKKPVMHLSKEQLQSSYLHGACLSEHSYNIRLKKREA